MMLQRRALLLSAPAGLLAGHTLAQPFGPSLGRRTNTIRNSTMLGAAAPSTMPTNWLIGAANGITPTVIGSGIENGLSYVDLRYSGTSSGTAIGAQWETTTQVAAVIGQVWTHSFYVSLVGGSLAGITSQVNITERVSNGAFLSNHLASAVTITAAPLATQRVAQTATLTGATCAFVVPVLSFVIPTATVLDWTLRIGAPQLERGSFATSWIPTAGAAVSAGATDIGYLTSRGP